MLKHVATTLLSEARSPDRKFMVHIIPLPSVMATSGLLELF